MKIFKRDLCLIRDLIFTVKRFNSVIAKSNHGKMKFICSVRSEILNAISRFIVPKEIDKTVNGFSVPLNWSYSNTSSYAHPIIQMLLKRIAVCSDGEDLDVVVSEYCKQYNSWKLTINEMINIAN